MSSHRWWIIWTVAMCCAGVVPVVPAASADADSSKLAVSKAYSPFDEPRPKIPQEIIDDKRLDQKVKVFVKSRNMKQLFADLSAKTGVKITANRELWGERPIIYFHKRPLRDVMTEISGLYGYHWLITGKAGAYEYEMFEDVRHAQRRDQLAGGGEVELFLAALKRFAAGKGAESLTEMAQAHPDRYQYLTLKSVRSLAHLLTLFGDDTIRGVFKEGSVSVPFGDLPQDLQMALVNWQKERVEEVSGTFQSLSSGMPAPPVRTSAEFLGSSVVLTKSAMTDSRISGSNLATLGIRVSNDSTVLLQDKWPPCPLSEDELRGIADRPASEKVLANPPLPAEPKVTVTSLRWTMIGKSVLLGDVLEAVARHSDWDVIADYHFGIESMPGIRERPLNQVVNDVCGRYQYSCQVEGNTMRFRYDNWYVEGLPVEPPAEALERWWKAIQATGSLGARDVMEIALLPDASSRWNGFRFIPGAKSAELMRNKKATISLWTSLTGSQESTARSEQGLQVSSLTADQQDRLAFWVNAMQAAVSANDMAEGVIRIERKDFGPSDIMPGVTQVGASAVEDLLLKLPRSQVGPVFLPGISRLSEQDRKDLIAQRKADAESDVIEVVQ